MSDVREIAGKDVVSRMWRVSLPRVLQAGIGFLAGIVPGMGFGIWLGLQAAVERPFLPIADLTCTARAATEQETDDRRQRLTIICRAEEEGGGEP